MQNNMSSLGNYFGNYILKKKFFEQFRKFHNHQDSTARENKRKKTKKNYSKETPN